MSRYDSPPQHLTLTEDVILQRPPPAPRKGNKRRPIRGGAELIPATTTPTRTRAITRMVDVPTRGNGNIRNDDDQQQRLSWSDDNGSQDRAFPLSPPAPKRLFDHEEEEEEADDFDIHNANFKFFRPVDEHRETEQYRRSPPAQREGNVQYPNG